MKKLALLTLVALATVGCSSTVYRPDNATTAVNLGYPNCPVGSVAKCDWSGGVLVGKRLSNCRCTN